jgi:hypothetical protein
MEKTPQEDMNWGTFVGGIYSVLCFINSVTYLGASGHSRGSGNPVPPQAGFQSRVPRGTGSRPLPRTPIRDSPG